MQVKYIRIAIPLYFHVKYTVNQKLKKKKKGTNKGI